MNEISLSKNGYPPERSFDFLLCFMTLFHVGNHSLLKTIIDVPISASMMFVSRINNLNKFSNLYSHLFEPFPNGNRLKDYCPV